MADDQASTTPAWQTEELQEEWVDIEDSVDDDLSYGTRSISLTTPLATHIHTNNDDASETSQSTNASPQPVGTFLVRQDIPSVPLLPKTPGRNKKGLMKDFFSPLPLERMFEPPSPPQHTLPPQPATVAAPSRRLTRSRQDEIIETDLPDMGSFHGRKASLACKFTFSVPRERLLKSNNTVFPQAQSTPTPPFAPTKPVPAPATDPRLRLFQFQYDTYTRDHLSAMVDSIAINTPSGTGTTPSPTSFTHHLSRVSEVTGTAEDMSHLRSAKRVKLSPQDHFYGEGAGTDASIARPKTAKDYLGESRNLMQKIKQARDFSTISTVASTQQNTPRPKEQDRDPSDKRNARDLPQRASSLAVLDVHARSTSGTATSKSGSSISSYRQQAAVLMAQIRSDVKGQKRVFSGDTDVSHITSHLDDKLNSFTRAPSPDAVPEAPSCPIQNKENQRPQASHHHRTPSAKPHSSRHKGSTRKSVAVPTSINEADPDEVSNSPMQDHPSQPVASVRSRAESRLTIQVAQSTHLAVPTGLAPPSYPSLRAGQNDDLNRFVSSSTASGTTLTAGSAPSFTKHQGPAHIRTIAPTDLPQLPDRLGDMLFDKVMMRWVKSTAQATAGAGEMDAYVPRDEVSEDPFGDIESLRDDSRRERRGERSRIVEASSGSDEDDEEMELTSFSTDHPTPLVVDVMTGVEDDETTDSDDDDPRLVIPNDEYDSEDAFQQSIAQVEFPNHPASLPGPSTNAVTPHRSHPLATTSVVRSAMKSHSATPTSALKDPQRVRYQTPQPGKRHRRSVSFSDGKRDGPIRGLVDVTIEGGVSTVSGFVPSARSKRIAQMMDALEDSDSDQSPSKMSGSSGRVEAFQTRRPDICTPSSSSRRTFSRSRTHRQSFTREKANATFLTECSFGVAHDRLVAVITDVQPFVPHWEQVHSINLSGKGLESVARLKELLPRLDRLKLNENQLAWLSGIPGSTRTLSVASNCLTGITSYGHLLNLESLDISRNDVESLSQLACLRHLRELKADGNKITSVEGLQRTESLVKLSLEGNLIRRIDLGEYRWNRLEMLNMGQNRLDSIEGLASLKALVGLNIDNNELTELVVEGNMGKLRILRVSGNRLRELRVGTMPNLRTLYADNNSLESLAKVDRLAKVENLSLRNQSGKGLNLLTRDVRDVQRLYLSGNPLKAGFFTEPCYSLVYLELAACRLCKLPEGLSKLVPNVRVLNLNYNFLEDVGSLEGLTRLKKLTVIGSRLKSSKGLIRVLRRMRDMEVVDFRMNPCTLGWYLPLVVKDVPGALGGRGEWEEVDRKFRRDLPDESYMGRLAYRGLIMGMCPGIRMVDGVEVSAKERAKAHDLLDRIGR